MIQYLKKIIICDHVKLSQIIIILISFFSFCSSVNALDLVSNPTDLQKGTITALYSNYTYFSPYGGQFYYGYDLYLSGTVNNVDFNSYKFDYVQYLRSGWPYGVFSANLVNDVGNFFILNVSHSDFGFVGNYVFDKTTQKSYKLNHQYYFLFQNYLLTVDYNNETVQYWQFNEDGTDVGHYSNGNFISQVPIQTISVNEDFRFPYGTQIYYNLSQSGSNAEGYLYQYVYPGGYKFGFYTLDNKFFTLGSLNNTYFNILGPFLFPPSGRGAKTPYSYIFSTDTGKNYINYVKDYSIFESSFQSIDISIYVDGITNENQNYFSGYSFNGFNFLNPYNYLRSIDGNYYKWDLNCFDSDFTSCRLNVADSKFYCANDDGNFFVSTNGHKVECGLELDIANFGSGSSAPLSQDILNGTIVKTGTGYSQIVGKDRIFSGSCDLISDTGLFNYYSNSYNTFSFSLASYFGSDNDTLNYIFWIPDKFISFGFNSFSNIFNILRSVVPISNNSKVCYLGSIQTVSYQQTVKNMTNDEKNKYTNLHFGEKTIIDYLFLFVWFIILGIAVYKIKFSNS